MDYVGMGKRVRSARLHMKLTQAELAEDCGLSTSFIGHIERASRKASIETIASIALRLNTSLDFLLLGESIEALRLTESIKPGLMPEHKELVHRIIITLYEHAEDWATLNS